MKVLTDFLLDIELLESNAARAELANYETWAYGDHGYNDDGELIAKNN